jgi:hypothetical protein
VYVAIIAGITAAWIYQRLRAKQDSYIKLIQRQHIIESTAFLIGFLPVTLLGTYLHYYVYGVDGAPLFFGGGSPELRWDNIYNSLKSVLIDLFIEGRSWYLPYRRAPFVELYIWPLALLGARIAWVKMPGLLVRGLILSLPTIIILSAMTGAYPGMRRAAGALPFIYLFSSIGLVYVITLWNNHSEKPKHPLQIAVISLAIATTVFGIIHSLYYQFSFGHKFANSNFGTGFVVEPFDHSDIIDALKKRDVVIDFPEGKAYFDKLFYFHYPRLVNRYRGGAPHSHKVHFLDDLDDEYVSTLVDQRNWMLTGWDPKRLYQLSLDYELCVNMDQFGLYNSIPFVAYSRPFSVQKRKGQCKNSSKFDFKVNSSVLLGSNHTKERVTHSLTCQGPYCDSSRRNFVYTMGGPVSFLLRVPDTYEPIDNFILRVHVLHGQENRESKIYIDSDFLGLLELGQVNATGNAEYIINKEKYKSGSIVKISVLPSDNKDKLGWDIDKVTIIQPE